MTHALVSKHGKPENRAALDWLVRNVPRLAATYVVTTCGHVYMIHSTSSPCIKCMWPTS